MWVFFFFFFPLSTTRANLNYNATIKLHPQCAGLRNRWHLWHSYNTVRTLHAQQAVALLIYFFITEADQCAVLICDFPAYPYTFSKWEALWWMRVKNNQLSDRASVFGIEYHIDDPSGIEQNQYHFHTKKPHTFFVFYHCCWPPDSGDSSDDVSPDVGLSH